MDEADFNVVVAFVYRAEDELIDVVELVPFPEGRVVVLTLNVALEKVGVTTEAKARWYAFPAESRPLKYT